MMFSGRVTAPGARDGRHLEHHADAATDTDNNGRKTENKPGLPKISEARSRDEMRPEGWSDADVARNT